MQQCLLERDILVINDSYDACHMRVNAQIQIYGRGLEQVIDNEL